MARSPISINAKTANTTSGALAAEINCSESNDNISIETVTRELEGMAYNTLVAAESSRVTKKFFLAQP